MILDQRFERALRDYLERAKPAVPVTLDRDRQAFTDTLCLRAVKKGQKVSVALPDPQGYQDVIEYREVLLPVVERFLASLKPRKPRPKAARRFVRQGQALLALV